MTLQDAGEIMKGRGFITLQEPASGAGGMPFVRAYFRETQELVFDAHDKAFQFYGGVCRRGIYDNMKTAVEVIFVGKARQYNRRFLQMCSHHLIEPVAWPIVAATTA